MSRVANTQQEVGNQTNKAAQLSRNLYQQKQKHAYIIQNRTVPPQKLNYSAETRADTIRTKKDIANHLNLEEDPMITPGRKRQ